MKCHYCGREDKIVCMNTRDMEDFAIEGDDICFATYEQRGGGERTVESVRIERDKLKAHRVENGDMI